MKISYNWLKQYLKTDKSAQELSLLLTDCGLEVESLEAFQSVKGGLQGLVIGEVMSKEKHPDADKLSLTTVNVGSAELLHIVCGAPNVEAGQKVVVAMVGAKLFPSEGEPFEIKKSKIRGAVSEGMICAEDEIGLGVSHAGIMVLDANAKVGTAAADYFDIENDFVFEIGLTPNRVDAASHVGVARDLYAVLTSLQANASSAVFQLPVVPKIPLAAKSGNIEVQVEDQLNCLRYSGLSFYGAKVTESPDWLKNRLKAIGLRPINSIVDITNFVLHELGQPLHAFDLDKISGEKIVVRKAKDKTKFTTLDGIVRELSSEDLMICDAKNELCIAGVFGGLDSGVCEQSTNIFLESAYFNPVSVRKTAKRHGLKTDASFRFERGTDPNITVYALERAAQLIQEITGAKAAAEISDFYPNPVQDFAIEFSYEKCHNSIGKEIPVAQIKSILLALGIKIVREDGQGLSLQVPPFKVDVQREIDVIEEVLRIYGYNNVEIPERLNSSLSFAVKPDREKMQNIAADSLSAQGFTEIMSLSLTKSNYAAKSEYWNSEENVAMLNPLSSDLDVLRQSLLFSGLEAIAYNQNRKRSDLKLYEFGKTYHKKIKSETDQKFYSEKNHLALFISGKNTPESWLKPAEQSSFYHLKAAVTRLLERMGIDKSSEKEISKAIFSTGLSIEVKQKVVAEIGVVSKQALKALDIKSAVFYADIDWDALVKLAGNNKITFSELPKFPEVRRDLALLIDKQVTYAQLQELAFQTEKKLLKAVNLFDVYEGDKLEQGKKSYALSFLLQDEEATLTDKQIENTMDKLIRNYKEKLGANIR